MALEIGSRTPTARKRPVDKFVWRSSPRPRSPTHQHRAPGCVSTVVLIAIVLPALCALSAAWRVRRLVLPNGPIAWGADLSPLQAHDAQPHAALPRLPAAVPQRLASVPDLSAVQREAGAQTEKKEIVATPLPSGLEEPPAGLFLPSAPLHAVNPSGPRFVSLDCNNPTKVLRPPWGFPPRSLPRSHPQYDILRDIRVRTLLNPRWPDYPELNLQKLRSYGPAYASIIISDKLKVVYVPVFKVGTTSMMWNIAFLENMQQVVKANISDAGVRDYLLHDFHSNLWHDHAAYSLPSARVRATLNDPSYLKFGFVRNPYHRIVSAYLDKVVKWPFESAEYQVQMYGLYGENHEMRALRNRTKPSFKEFLSAIEKVIAMPRTRTSDLNHPDSFEDNSSRRDLHWRPQVELLHPDLIHFDFLGRFDRMDDDKQHVLKWMYRHTDRRMPETRRRLHTTDPKDKVGLLQLLREDEAARQTLLRIYKSDFDRFGFSREVPSANEHAQ